MTNPGIPPKKPGRPFRYTVAGWVQYDEPPCMADKTVEWTYQRGDLGDLVVHATTKDDAVRTLQAHGFVDLDLKKLKQTGGTLADYAKAAAKVPIT